MSDTREKITNFFNSLTTKEKLILLFILVVILVVFYILVINNNYRGTDINYKDLKSENIIEYSSVVYDRDEILVIDEVVDEILKINDGTWVLNNEPITIKDIYSQVVTPNYKKKMSYNKFKNALNSVYQKVLGENGKYDSGKNYIDTVFATPHVVI